MANKAQITVLIGCTAFAAIAFLTRPKKKAFVEHIQASMKKEGGLLGNIGSLAVPLAVNDMNTALKDFLLFTVIEWKQLDKTYYYIGAFGVWVRVN